MGDKSAYMGTGGYDGSAVHKNQESEEYAYAGPGVYTQQNGASYSPYGAGSQGVARSRNDVSAYMEPYINRHSKLNNDLNVFHFPSSPP